MMSESLTAQPVVSITVIEVALIGAIEVSLVQILSAVCP